MLMDWVCWFVGIHSFRCCRCDNSHRQSGSVANKTTYMYKHACIHRHQAFTQAGCPAFCTTQGTDPTTHTHRDTYIHTHGERTSITTASSLLCAMASIDRSVEPQHSIAWQVFTYCFSITLAKLKWGAPPPGAAPPPKPADGSKPVWCALKEKLLPSPATPVISSSSSSSSCGK
jgi:hypothetical protein